LDFFAVFQKFTSNFPFPIPIQQQQQQHGVATDDVTGGANRQQNGTIDTGRCNSDQTLEMVVKYDR
jgi:hypothetical protein